MNPLADYLARAKITQAAFAERLTRIYGARIKQQRVSLWVGGVLPRLSHRRLISRASGGKVPVESWGAAGAGK
jgi:hypothetical protein